MLSFGVGILPNGSSNTFSLEEHFSDLFKYNCNGATNICKMWILFVWNTLVIYCAPVLQCSCNAIDTFWGSFVIKSYPSFNWKPLNVKPENSCTATAHMLPQNTAFFSLYLQIFVWKVSSIFRPMIDEGLMPFVPLCQWPLADLDKANLTQFLFNSWLIALLTESMYDTSIFSHVI